MVIYEGPSLITGKPIVVIGIPGSNPKIGTMLCIHILCQEFAPEIAAFEGMDDSICGDCKFRVPVGTARKLHDTSKIIDGTTPNSFAENLAYESLIKREGELFQEAKDDRLCYVRLSSLDDSFGPKADEEMGPSEIWRKWKNGEWKLDCFKAGIYGDYTCKDRLVQYRGLLTVRIGSYGDPAAVPTRVWEELVKYARNFTGYTHQWRNDWCDSDLKKYCMASVDTEEEREEANKLGWRAFVVAPADVDVSLLKDDVLCPMTAGKNVTCDKCHMCQGISSKVRPNIWEKAHGVNLKNHKW